VRDPGFAVHSGGRKIKCSCEGSQKPHERTDSSYCRYVKSARIQCTVTRSGCVCKEL